jgi:tRNA pseudouridine38-40 synthase
LTGTLIWVGTGRLSSQDFAAILAGKDRQCAGPTAPACGLFLERVGY